MENYVGREMTKGEREFYGIGEKISLLYLFCILLIYPLYIRDGYFDILQAKFSYFWISSLTYAAVMTTFVILYFFTVKKEIRNKLIFSLFFRMEGDKKKPFLMTDLIFLGLVTVYLISMLLSGYIYEGWWGSTGRYMGFFLWFLLFLSYFFLTRFYRFKKIHLLFLSFSVFLQASWGISDFFWMNLFHFFDKVQNKSLWSTFAGGVGNINGYTSLMISYSGLFAGLFLGEKKGKWSILFLLMYAYTLIASMYGMSDNAVFAIFVLFLILPFFCFGKKELLLNCLDLYVAFFLIMKLATFFISDQNNSYVIGDKGFFLQLGYTTLPFLAIAVLGIMKLAIVKLKEERIESILKPIYILLVALILFTVFFVFYDANSSHRLSFLNDYSNYFRFDDYWGSGRGFIWKMGLDFFTKKMPFWQKFFGYGPDSFYMITNDHYKLEISQSAYQAIDNIHNEYLNLLLTVGIFGLLSYLLFLFFTWKSLWSKRSWDEEDSFCFTVFPFATGLSLLCYAGQAVINIAVPIVLPIIFVLFFLGLSSKANMK